MRWSETGVIIESATIKLGGGKNFFIFFLWTTIWMSGTAKCVISLQNECQWITPLRSATSK